MNEASERMQQSRARATIGHVHLKVRDASRAAAFYSRILGLSETERIGQHFVFMAGNGAHHELALQSLGSGAAGPDDRRVGLYHSAWEVADARALLGVLEILDADGVAHSDVDHGISWAIYFDDPDGNGVEVYLDRRRAADGSMAWDGASRRLERRTIAAAAWA
ncbi:MAG: VOC family protein [Planctomycetota bacterium]|nr:VOC family protein [Planctomycetota bacterium]